MVGAPRAECCSLSFGTERKILSPSLGWIRTIPGYEVGSVRYPNSTRPKPCSRTWRAFEKSGWEASPPAKRVVLALHILAVVASIWFLVTGHVIPSITLVVLPFATCFAFARSGGLIRVHRDYPNPMGAVLASAFVLPLKTAMSITAGYYFDLLPLTAIVGGVFCLALAKPARPAGPRWRIAALLLLSLLYGYGAGMQLNTLLDTSPPTVYQAEILKKYIYRGKRTVHKLRLGAWGKRGPGWGVAVDPGLWESWKPGDRVCFSTRAGALGVEWFADNQIQPCK